MDAGLLVWLALTTRAPRSSIADAAATAPSRPGATICRAPRFSSSNSSGRRSARSRTSTVRPASIARSIAFAFVASTMRVNAGDLVESDATSAGSLVGSLPLMVVPNWRSDPWPQAAGLMASEAKRTTSRIIVMRGIYRGFRFWKGRKGVRNPTEARIHLPPRDRMEPSHASSCLKLESRGADCVRDPSGPHWTREIRKLVMRIGVLTLSVFVAAWLVPGSGSLCRSEAVGHESEQHGHSAESHTHAQPGSHHEHTHHSSDETHSGSTQGPSSHSHESECCDTASDLPALRAVTASQQSRLEIPPVRAWSAIAAVEATPPLATTLLLRRLQPPVLPYERTHRPLLI